jgi:hypothetical protein
MNVTPTRPGDPVYATTAYGLTKREWLFAQALQGLLMAGTAYGDYETTIQEAKAIADASITALNTP